MSQNKKGVSFFEEDDKLVVVAKDNFSESASLTSEIFSRVQSESKRSVRLHLSSKTKSFQDTFFRIRQIAIENDLNDIKILINSRPRFKQTFDENGVRTITTPYYSATCDGSLLRIDMTYKGKIFANEPEAKEMANLIKVESPENLEIFFSSAEQEKESDTRKRIQALQSFFVQHLTSIYSIKKVSFYVKSKPVPHLFASLERMPDCKKLIQTVSELPVFRVKHRRRSDTFDPKQIIKE